MKRGSKKSESDDVVHNNRDTENLSSDKTGNEKTASDQNSIDAILVLQIIAMGIGLLVLVGYVLRNFLHIL